MKNTTTYSYKAAIAATALVMAYFTSGIASIAQANELLKAEPVQHVTLIQDAQASLKLSFSTLAITDDASNSIASPMMAKQVKATKESPLVILTKTTQISE